MTPKNIDWPMFLGTEFSLAPDMPFDRAKFAQWRCYWDFGAGMFTDLFVHRTTSMLEATGLRFPGRVVGAGGIYFEYDGRDVPDVATVVADFPEGVQGLVTPRCAARKRRCRRSSAATTARSCSATARSSTATISSPSGRRPRTTARSRTSGSKSARSKNTSLAHFENFCDAAIAGKPDQVNCSPELGAAAMVIVKLGSQSYRQGKVFHFDRETMTVKDADASWAKRLGEDVARRRLAEARARLEGRRQRQQALPARVPEAGRPVDQRRRPGGSGTRAAG